MVVALYDRDDRCRNEGPVVADVTGPEKERPYATVTAADESSILDLAPTEIIDLYKVHGALLLRGFAPDLDAFRRFAERFCISSAFNESPGRLLLDRAHNIQSVNGGSEPFPLHPELSREPWKPDVCFFCCLSPPRSGGETTICDGVELVRALPDEVRDGLAGRRLLYIQPAKPELLEFWLGTASPSDAELRQPPAECPYSFYRVREQVVRAFTRPALHKPMFSENPAFGNFLLFARYYLGLAAFPAFDDGRPVPGPWVEAVKEAADRLTAPIAWQKGDLLMLDNTRFMHGRNAIVDVDERLIASYFGYLSFGSPNPEEPANPIWRRAAFRPPEARAAGAAPAEPSRREARG